MISGGTRKCGYFLATLVAVCAAFFVKQKVVFQKPEEDWEETSPLCHDLTDQAFIQSDD